MHRVIELELEQLRDAPGAVDPDRHNRAQITDEHRREELAAGAEELEADVTARALQRGLLEDVFVERDDEPRRVDAERDRHEKCADEALLEFEPRGPAAFFPAAPF